MKLCRFVDNKGAVQLGNYTGNDEAELVTGSLTSGYKTTATRASVSKWLAPIEPTAILCIGLNYRAHAAETGAELPEHPVLFMKNPAALNHPNADIVIPRNCQDPAQVDYEVELAVVLGKDAKNVSTDNALDYVFGYTVANDVSARRWQKQGGGRQWIRGKSFDGFCPIGPFIVTRDEIADPQNLAISLTRNGETLQHANTNDMIFSVREIISSLSQGITLKAGTVILTGTPSGVGFTRKPPLFMQSGDIFALTIDGIGTLTNTVTYE